MKELPPHTPFCQRWIWNSVQHLSSRTTYRQPITFAGKWFPKFISISVLRLLLSTLILTGFNNVVFFSLSSKVCSGFTSMCGRKTSKATQQQPNPMWGSRQWHEQCHIIISLNSNVKRRAPEFQGRLQ